jgi:hypothetical protein
VSRRILVRVTPEGALSVEAEGFRGKGCEAATKAIEEALGQAVGRTLKHEHGQTAVVRQQSQNLGESSFDS